MKIACALTIPQKLQEACMARRQTNASAAVLRLLNSSFYSILFASTSISASILSKVALSNRQSRSTTELIFVVLWMSATGSEFRITTSANLPGSNDPISSAVDRR
jgi:hypothetical protein